MKVVSQKLILRFGMCWLLGSCASLAGLTALADAPWQLDLTQSELGLTSTKNSQISERHTLRFSSGSVSAEGRARVEVDLGSIETRIPIRNERMQKFLFAAATPALVAVDLEPTMIASLAAGEARSLSTNVVIKANNQEILLPIALLATPVDASQVRVSGTGELDVAALGYQAGIEALREIAGLKSISLNVPIDFVLTFQK